MPTAPSPQQILIVGDSHTHALSQAYAARGGYGKVDFSIQWIQASREAKALGNVSLQDALVAAGELRAPAILVLSILGTLHNVFGLLQHEVPFQIASSDEAFELSEDAMLVPEQALRDALIRGMRSKNLVRQFCDKAACPIFHLSTPPPKEDNQFIIQQTKRYRQRAVAEVGVSPPSLRQKLWRLEMQAMRDVCADWGISVLHPPRDAVSREGFLKRDYYANDATHANAAYGELVLRQLEDTVATAPEILAAG